MLDLPFGAAATDFRWCTGIEDTFIPQTRPGLRALDEYALMGHYEQWRGDLALAKQAGAQMIRWGIPWYRVEPQPGQFDWSWTDQVIPYIVDELGLEPILDLMHYGTPLWLKRSFVDPRYPEAVAAYAQAVAARYGNRIRYYTPLNEPIVNALMCGMRGIWPPYLRGERGFLAVGIALAQGIIQTVRAIHAVDPAAVMVHVEAAGLTRAARADLEPLAVDQRRRGFLFYDLITGRVDATHPLFGWLLTNGVSYTALQQLSDQAIELDVMGLNFYPQWSTQQVELNAKGHVRYRSIEQDGAGFRDLITDYYERYGVPIMITETSAKDGIPIKERWLATSIATIRSLRQSGVPVIGYTWFPLFTMIDWRYRSGRRPVQEYLLELGLYESESTVEGLRYVATPLVEQFKTLTLDPTTAVGDLQRVSSLVPA
jgi:beta-glucosidase/6-phospho-beta-glucosidase/beta-galactosidase